MKYVANKEIEISEDSMFKHEYDRDEYLNMLGSSFKRGGATMDEFEGDYKTFFTTF